MLRVWYDVDDNWYAPLCQVFSHVYRYDVYHRASCAGVAQANREILKIGELYRPKYVLLPATTFTVTEDTLMALRRIGCVVLGRFFDDDDRFDKYSKWLVPSLDYCVTNVPERVPQYEGLGGRCVLMTVEGHNEGVWQRLLHVPKQFDVSFVGAVYASRGDRLRALRELGISVSVVDTREEPSRVNKLSLTDLVRVVNESRINLNFTLDGYTPPLGIRQIKGRIFEIAMAGGFVLTEYAPELERYFEIGWEVVYFDSITEAAEKIRYYLQHADEREEIAAHGYERAQRDYTSRVLFRKVFLQIEEDLRKRGRPVPGERPVGTNPMRQTAAEYHYKWAQLLLKAPEPLYHTWRESVDLALASNPFHEGARRMLETYNRWGDPRGPLVRSVKRIRSIRSRAVSRIYEHARRNRTIRWAYAHMRPRRVLEQLGERVASTHLGLARNLHGQAPIALGYWVRLGSLAGAIFGKQDPLSPPLSSLRTSGRSLAIPDLQQLLWDDVLGEWSLDAATISLVWRELHRDQPRTILECGSGVSTLCLAKYAQLQSAEMGTPCTVISLEQDEQIKRMVEQRLVESGLDNWAEILYAPIIVEHKHDIEIWNYDVDRANLSAKLGARKADWVLVDGPAGPKGCRFGTVPMLAKLSRRSARWFLDDAFRDGELEILQRWQRLPNIEVVGIYPIGKGLATGYFVG